MASDGAAAEADTSNLTAYADPPFISSLPLKSGKVGSSSATPAPKTSVTPEIKGKGKIGAKGKSVGKTKSEKGVKGDAKGKDRLALPGHGPTRSTKGKGSVTTSGEAVKGFEKGVNSEKGNHKGKPSDESEKGKAKGSENVSEKGNPKGKSKSEIVSEKGNPKGKSKSEIVSEKGNQKGKSKTDEIVSEKGNPKGKSKSGEIVSEKGNPKGKSKSGEMVSEKGTQKGNEKGEKGNQKGKDRMEIGEGKGKQKHGKALALEDNRPEAWDDFVSSSDGSSPSLVEVSSEEPATITPPPKRPRGSPTGKGMTYSYPRYDPQSSWGDWDADRHYYEREVYRRTSSWSYHGSHPNRSW